MSNAKLSVGSISVRSVLNANDNEAKPCVSSIGLCHQVVASGSVKRFLNSIIDVGGS